MPEPALLPQGFELKQAVWADRIVRLIHGPRNYRESMLFIFMQPNENLPPEGPTDSAEVVQASDWNGWYWRGIYFVVEAVEGKPHPDTRPGCGRPALAIDLEH